MKCPRCPFPNLEQRMGPKGLLIDVCPECTGVWLDTGEVYHYVKDMAKLHALFSEAYKTPQPSPLKCPRCVVAMAEVKLPPSGPLIEACAKCGGNWFDAGEISALNSLLDKGIAPQASVTLKASPAAGPTWPQEQSEQLTPQQKSSWEQLAWQQKSAQNAAAGPGLMLAALPSLPNLGMRSLAVMASLYGILAAVCFMIVAVMKFPLEYAFLGAAFGIFLNFLIGPFIMDLSLRWVHRFRWVEPSELPPHLREFINATCNKEGIPFPKCGIIEDDNPNAFTYGHIPSNARLVFSRGVLKILSPEELLAVIGHEIGHIVHWDMLVMTLAMLVPMILYGIYRACLKIADKVSGSRDAERIKLPLIVVGMIALLLHYITEYVVLFLSRTRELHADRYGAELTGRPNALAAALVKIAYGLAGRKEEGEAEGAKGRPPQLAAAMGVFDPVSARALVASSLSGGNTPSMTNILGAMQWDMWNPWAGYYELHSTHPLPARRIELLGKQAASMGQQPYVRFDLEQPESYWDEFLVDVAMLFLPWLLAGAAGGWAAVNGMGTRAAWFAGAAWGFGALIRTWFSYESDGYPAKNVSALLKHVKVSAVRGVSGNLRGKIIGKGIPGMLFSEDLVLQDNSGYIFLDYAQPLALFQWIFALRRGNSLVGREVIARGWYRRAPVPYFELRDIECDGETSTCRTLEAKYFFAAMVMIVSVVMSLGIY